VKAAERQRNVAARSRQGNEGRCAGRRDRRRDDRESIQVPAIPSLGRRRPVTPEAATVVACRAGWPAGDHLAEGGIFDIIAGRYSGAIPNMDLWFKSHAGDPMRVDRKGRPPGVHSQASFDSGLMISTVRAVDDRRSPRIPRTRILARILYARPASKVGRRKIAATPVPETVQG